MYRHHTKKRQSHFPRRVKALIVGLIVLALIGTFTARFIYNQDLKPVKTSSSSSQTFTVESGATVSQIANDLQSAGLIRSSWAFELYVHSFDLSDSLEAGTYSLSASQSMPDIISQLTHGKVSTKLVTILPGDRIDQIQQSLINSGFSQAAVNNALNPANYSDLPVLAFKPANVNNLEGLLWPDSYQKDNSTTAEQIVRESLTEMGEHLTPSVQANFASEGLTTYQGVTLASIILQEVNKPTDQTQVAQVFLSRLKLNMPLGSDVTAYYGSIAAGVTPSLTYDSPYNTLIHTGLPPTPISNINTSSLYAAQHPANTNWLYFVAGDDGTTYFSTTLAQQQANTAQYCHKLCGQ